MYSGQSTNVAKAVYFAADARETDAGGLCPFFLPATAPPPATRETMHHIAQNVAFLVLQGY